MLDYIKDSTLFKLTIEHLRLNKKIQVVNSKSNVYLGL